LKVEKTGKRKKKYQVNNCANGRKYSRKEKGDVELTSGTTKLMAISSRKEEEIEGSKNRWRRSLLEFLSFSNDAAAREIGLEGVE